MAKEAALSEAIIESKKSGTVTLRTNSDKSPDKVAFESDELPSAQITTTDLDARLQKEALDIKDNYSDLLKLEVINADQRIWHVHFAGASNSIYQDEKFSL